MSSSITMKFSEAKLKPDLSNYLDWARHMTTYLTYQKVGSAIEEPTSASTEDKSKIDENNIKAYFAIEAQCEVETRRSYLIACSSSAFKAWKALQDAYEQMAAIGKPYIRQQLRLLRLDSFADMRSYVQKHKDLIRQYNELAASDKPTEDSENKKEEEDPLGMGGQDVIGLSEAVDLICSNLPDEWDGFTTSLQQMADLLGTKITILMLEKALIVEEAKRKVKNPDINDTGEKRALYGQQDRRSRGNPRRRKFMGACYNCGKKGHKAADCWSEKKQDDDVKDGDKASGRRNRPVGAFMAIVEPGPVQNHDVMPWILDSGASSHMTMRRDAFISYQALKKPTNIVIGDGERLPAVGKGTIRLEIKEKSGERTIDLLDTYHVPRIHHSLLSIYRMVKGGCRVTFGSGGCEIQKTGISLLAPDRGGVWTIEGRLCKDDQGSEGLALLSLQEAHERLGHVGEDCLRRMARLKSMDGIEKLTLYGHISCKSCDLTKSHIIPNRKVLPLDRHRRMDLIHMDYCQWAHTKSVGGHVGFLGYLEANTLKSWVRFVKDKKAATVLSKSRSVIRIAERQSNTKLIAIQHDEGTEFTDTDKFCSDKGITVRETAAYASHQNGSIERLNRTLVERARAMLLASGLPRSMWAEAVKMANFIRNITLSRTLEAKGDGPTTPEERWSGRRYDIANLQPFGAICYVHVDKSLRKKPDNTAKEMRLVGYESDNTYRVWDPVTQNLYVRRDVKFSKEEIVNGSVGADEKEDAYWEKVLEEENPEEDRFSIAGSEDRENSKDIDEHTIVVRGTPLDNQEEHDGPSEQLMRESSQRRSMAEEGHVRQARRAYEDRSESPSPPPGSFPRSPEAAAQPRRSDRQATKRDFYGDLVPSDQRKKRDPYTGLMALVEEQTPASYEEAIASPNAVEWKASMNREMASIKEHGVWENIKERDLRHDDNIVDCKWVYQQKKGADGRVTLLKSRLVARGFSQQYGIDYEETFAPVAKIATIRLLVALAAHLDLEIEQMDVMTAFLCGVLKERIVMRQPPGYRQDNDLCLLKKTLYGLKQSSREWYAELAGALEALGFWRSSYDASLFVHPEGMVVLIYVDDLLLIGSQREQISSLKKDLAKRFKMKDLGAAACFIGMEIQRDRQKGTILLHQNCYTKDILKRYHQNDNKPHATPMEAGGIPHREEHGPEMKNPTIYRQMVGSYMYLLATRPECAFTASKLGQYFEAPTSTVERALHRAMSYLRGSVAGLEYKKIGDQGRLLVEAYADADWAGCKDTRRSTTGYAILLNGTAISFGSHKQKTVATSTTEAEYVAAGACAREAIWILGILGDLSRVLPIEAPRSMALHIDNKGALSITKDAKDHSRTKHIDIQHHFIRELVQRGTVIPRYVKSKDNRADVLTKALPREAHLVGMQGLGMKTQHQEERS
jgi:hypothetical protein